MAMKLKLTFLFVLLIVFLSFTLLVSTLEARPFAPNHLRHAIMKPENPSQQGQALQLDEVLEVLDLLGIKDSSGPSKGGGGH
ncbi:hypothetical protein DITRI_Ditri16bG0128300 [Diplodiscus trichospermus]